MVGNHQDVIIPEVETADNNMISFRRTFGEYYCSENSLLLVECIFIFSECGNIRQKLQNQQPPQQPFTHCIPIRYPRRQKFIIYFMFPLWSKY